MTEFKITCDEVTLHRSDANGVIGEELARKPAPESGHATFSVPAGRRQIVCVVSWLRGQQLLISDRMEFDEDGGEISFGPFPLTVTTDERLVNQVRVTTEEGAVSHVSDSVGPRWRRLFRW